jgi:hypothetical protein
MNEKMFTGGQARMLAFQKLKVFLTNPGKFCLIVLGSRGTGKHFAIDRAFEQCPSKGDKELCLQKIKFLSTSEIPQDEENIDKLFKDSQHQTLVVEDVEDLNDEQQNLLFTALSTEDGRFGIESKYNLRFVFTSSEEADSLRAGDSLQGLFWDRISQLIVEFPSFKIEKESIMQDFIETWKKMKFQETKNFEHLGGIPKNAKLETFLENHADKFEGGFRDLDKITCLYFNYRIYYYENKKKILEEIENKIVEDVIIDFFGKSQLHSSSGNDLSTFQILPGVSWNDLKGQFKIQVRNWGKKEYKTIAKAEERLVLKPGTMKNWTNRKVTKEHKARFEKSSNSK